MTKLYRYIQQIAHDDGVSSKEWGEAGAVDQQHYRAGSSNTCLIIMDYMERNPDCLKEIDEPHRNPPV